jgi:hypothetical protein
MIIELWNCRQADFRGHLPRSLRGVPRHHRRWQGLDAYVAVDASGTFSETKRQVGLLRMLQASVIVSDYASLMVEILKDNARPEAGAVYGAMDMPWAKLPDHLSARLASPWVRPRWAVPALARLPLR